MREIEKNHWKSISPFDYYGDANAEHIIIAMGSVCDTTLGEL